MPVTQGRRRNNAELEALFDQIILGQSVHLAGSPVRLLLPRIRGNLLRFIYWRARVGGEWKKNTGVRPLSPESLLQADEIGRRQLDQIVETAQMRQGYDQNIASAVVKFKENYLGGTKISLTLRNGERLPRISSKTARRYIGSMRVFLGFLAETKQRSLMISKMSPSVWAEYMTWREELEGENGRREKRVCLTPEKPESNRLYILVRSGPRPRTLRNDLNALIALVDLHNAFAARELSKRGEGFTSRNALRDIDRAHLNSQEKIKFICSQQNVQAIIDACTPSQALFVAAAALTGGRAGALARLTVDHFDETKGTIYFELDKRDSGRTQALIPEAIDIFMQAKRQVSPSPIDGRRYLFPSSAGHLMTNPSGTFRPIMKRLKDEGIIDRRMRPLHDFRHFFVTMMIGKSYPLAEIAPMIGHSQQRTTELYGHLSAEQQLQSLYLHGDLSREAFELATGNAGPKMTVSFSFAECGRDQDHRNRYRKGVMRRAHAQNSALERNGSVPTSIQQAALSREGSRRTSARTRWLEMTAPEKKALVWSRPGTQIAADWDISETLLRKWCREDGIDRPPQGHWQQRRRSRSQND